MQSTAPCPLARRAISRARLLDAPLNDLLVELGVELHQSSITDPGFAGVVVQRGDGSVFLSMPSGRPPLERDVIARAMLGQLVGVPLGDLPNPYRLTEI